MSVSQVASGDRIIDPMIVLAGCSMQSRIIVAGSKSTELMIELHRRGYLRAVATANCDRPAGQYEVALVDWRRRTPRELEATLVGSVSFLLRPVSCSLGRCPEASGEPEPSQFTRETRLRHRADNRP
jgi:hypothetical protein